MIFKDINMISESKIMASTLIISLLFHTGLFCLFTIFSEKNQYPEKVLTVGLVLPSSIGDHDLRPERFIPKISGRTLGKIIQKPMADIKKRNQLFRYILSRK